MWCTQSSLELGNEPRLGLYLTINYVAGKPPNITLRVISRIEQPFVMFKKQKEGEEVLVGNDRFEVGLLPAAQSYQEASTSNFELQFQHLFRLA